MNNDLIRRGELEWKAEMLISAARVMAGEDKVCQKAIDLMQQIVDLAKTLPAVDAVEVVRCKDCKNWEPSGSEMGDLFENMEPIGGCRYVNFCRKASDFCSYGERRE